MNDFIDYYQLLGIDFDATDDAIDRAYRTKIKLVHPDRNGGANDAVEHTKRLNEARDVLKDPVKHGAYRARWLAHTMTRLRNKKNAAPRQTSHAPQHDKRDHGWKRPPPPVAWTPPPPPVPSAAPVGGGGWGGPLGFLAVLLGGAYLLSKKNGFDQQMGRYRGADGTFRSGPFS
jgi:curved DNA-binding protein CbpA